MSDYMQELGMVAPAVRAGILFLVGPVLWEVEQVQGDSVVAHPVACEHIPYGLVLDSSGHWKFSVARVLSNQITMEEYAGCAIEYSSSPL